MIELQLCYDDGTQELCERLRTSLSGFQDCTYKAWNVDDPKQRRKAFIAKSKFAAREIPFCGLLDDKTAVKGFYSEVQECTYENIITYVKDYHAKKMQENKHKITTLWWNRK